MHFGRAIPVYIQEEHEASIKALLPSGIKMVVWLAHQAQFTHKLLQTTGSEDHLQQLANLAARKGLVLGQISLPDSNQPHGYPERRGNLLRARAALDPSRTARERIDVESINAPDLNNLIKVEDILCDLHVHSTWSDGKNSIEEMAKQPLQRNMTHMAIAIIHRADEKVHGCLLFRTAGLRDRRSPKGIQNGFTILKGVEVDILPMAA